MATFPTNLKVTKDRLKSLQATMRALGEREVLVGFPDETADRKVDPKNSPADAVGITNASLGYIHDKGAPEQNIPARPFMIPGMNSAKGAAIEILTAIAKGALKQDVAPDAVEKGFNRLGLKVQAAIRLTINAGVPPPLSEATLRKRANRGGKGYGSRKGAKLELELRAAGWDPSVDFAKPLVDTGQLRNALTYVIRPRRLRPKK